MKRAHQVVVIDLNRQLEEATAELRGALRAGIDPMQIRRRIKTIESELGTAAQRMAQELDDDRQRLADGATKEGERLADEVTSRIAGALKSFDFTKDNSMDHSSLDVQTDDIRYAANHLALCRAELSLATEAHAVAAEEVQTLQSRISVIESSRADITAARLSGTIDPQGANEFVVLGADAEVLRQMLAETQHIASEIVPFRQRAAVARAEEELKRVETQAVFTALTARVSGIENALLDAVRALRDTGVALGHRHLSNSYRSGEGLRRLVLHGAFLP